MCKTCKRKFGSSYHQIYWMLFFLLKFNFRYAWNSFYHLINRSAYRRFFNKKNKSKVELMKIGSLKFPLDTDAPDDYINWLFDAEPIDYLNEHYGLK